MERYLAICQPLYQYTMAGFNRAVKIIGLVWVISFLSSLPYAVFTKLNYIDRPRGSGQYMQDSAFCALIDDNIWPRVNKNFLLQMILLKFLLGLPSLPALIFSLLPPPSPDPHLPLC